jgi:hypothetical protein
MQPVSITNFQSLKREIIQDLSSENVSEEELSVKVYSLLKTVETVLSSEVSYAKDINAALLDLGKICSETPHQELAIKISNFISETSKPSSNPNHFPGSSLNLKKPAAAKILKTVQIGRSRLTTLQKDIPDLGAYIASFLPNAGKASFAVVSRDFKRIPPDTVSTVVINTQKKLFYFLRALKNSPVNWEELTSLNITRLDIQDKDLALIEQKCPHLQSLNLHKCAQITNKGIEHIKGLRNLQSLGLNGCIQITDAGLSHLKDFANLQSLDLSFCNLVDGSGLVYLKDLENFQSLKLSYCSGINGSTLGSLRDLENFESLNLEGCNQIADADLECIKSLKKLQILSLELCNRITDAGLENLKNLINLQYLNLHWCNQITDVGLRHLNTLPNLRILDLSRCPQITDAGLEHLDGLINLLKLGLIRCDEITDKGKASLRAFIPSLRIID